MGPELTEQQKLEAWCEWKKWCSVLRVKNPCPTDEEIADGKADMLSSDVRKRYYEYLGNDIIRGAIPDGDSDYRRWLQYQDERNDFLSCFDLFMKSEKKSETEEFAGRSVTYKDYIFHKMQNSSDPPLKVLHGKITGPRGYIRDIIKDYIIRNQATISKIPNSDAFLAVSNKVSADERINEDSGLTYGDMLSSSDRNIEGYIDPAEVQTFCAALSQTEKAIMVAVSNNIALDSPELQTLTGLKKTSLYEVMNRLMVRLRFALRNAGMSTREESGRFMESVTEFIFSSLSAEKTALPFLKLVQKTQQCRQPKAEEKGKRDVQMDNAKEGETAHE